MGVDLRASLLPCIRQRQTQAVAAVVVTRRPKPTAFTSMPTAASLTVGAEQPGELTICVDTETGFGASCTVTLAEAEAGALVKWLAIRFGLIGFVTPAEPPPPGASAMQQATSIVRPWIDVLGLDDVQIAALSSEIAHAIEQAERKAWSAAIRSSGAACNLLVFRQRRRVR